MILCYQNISNFRMLLIYYTSFISCDEAINLLWLTDYQIIRVSVTDKFYEMTTSYINNINSRRYIEI